MMVDDLQELCDNATLCNTRAREFVERFSTCEDRPKPPLLDYWGPGNRAYTKLLEAEQMLKSLRKVREACDVPKLILAWWYVEQGTLTEPLQKYDVAGHTLTMAHQAAFEQVDEVLALARSVGICSPERDNLEENFAIVERAAAVFSMVKLDDLCTLIRREYLKAIDAYEKGPPVAQIADADAEIVDRTPTPQPADGPIGNVRTDTRKKTGVNHPVNPDDRDAIALLAMEYQKPKKERNATRVIMGHYGFDIGKAQNKLRNLRRYKHLFDPDFNSDS